MGVRTQPEIRQPELAYRRYLIGMFRGFLYNFLILLLLMPLLAGCDSGKVSGREAPPEFTRIFFTQLSGWNKDNSAAAMSAFMRSCDSFDKMEAGKTVGSGILAAPVEIWQEICRDARKVAVGDVSQAKVFFSRNFVPLRLRQGKQQSALLTGYFEPLLYGSREKKGRYRFPIYKLPPEISVVRSAQVAATPSSYFSRREIDEGALAGRGLELLWVDDDIELFFLHIQGSGQVQLTDGTITRVGYAGKNNRPYHAIGKTLIERGALTKDNVSMLTIKHWLWNHPHEVKSILWQNPSYIFFREISGNGPIGSQGVALTPQRSLAVDPEIIPLGMPVFINTTLPSPPLQSPETFSHLLIAQDSGSAIKGALRGDIFFGSGNKEGIVAGFMKQRGEFTILVPRKIAGKLPFPQNECDGKY